MAGATEPTDPFDLEHLRSTPLPELAVERVTLVVPVRRPARTEFFRVCPDPEFSVDCYVYERTQDMERETYWVRTEFQSEILDDLRPVRLYTVINKRSTVYLWPAKLPTTGGSKSGNRWAQSALAIAEEAKNLWVKMIGDKDSGAYELYKARGNLEEPDWESSLGGKRFDDLLRLGFTDKVIDHLDHPVLKELRGEL